MKQIVSIPFNNDSRFSTNKTLQEDIALSRQLRRKLGPPIFGPNFFHSFHIRLITSGIILLSGRTASAIPASAIALGMPHTTEVA
jgi:hypothetical protein